MTETLSQDSLERAAELIWQADALVVTAGVGMSVDSILPDLRGKVISTQDMSIAYPSVTLGDGKVDLLHLACPDAFRSHPRTACGAQTLKSRCRFAGNW